MAIKSEANENLATDEQPLDPAAEKVRRKMVRLLGVSIGVMMIGLMAVLGAIVYKIGQDKEEDTLVADTGSRASALVVPEKVTEENLLKGEIALPKGAVLQGSSLDGDRVLLHVRLADGTHQLHIFDLASGQIFVRLDLR